MKRIRIMPEYGCHPLWDLGATPPRNVSAREVGASAELDARFAAWAERFEATLNQDYPPDSGFTSQAELDAFEEEGRSLRASLERALGCIVEYRSSAAVRAT